MTGLEALTAFIPVIIWIVVIFVIVRKVKSGVKKVNGGAYKAAPPSKHKAAPVTQTAKPVKAPKQHVNASADFSAGKRLLTGSSFGEMEDKTHDWLARQMAYEASIKPKIDEMFALRNEHSLSCEADRVKKMHEKNCDAGGVDFGQY